MSAAVNAIGPLLVSAVILALFAAQSLGYAAAVGDNARLMETCLTLVIGYWLGSSHKQAPPMPPVADGK